MNHLLGQVSLPLDLFGKAIEAACKRYLHQRGPHNFPDLLRVSIVDASGHWLAKSHQYKGEADLKKGLMQLLQQAFPTSKRKLDESDGSNSSLNDCGHQGKTQKEESHFPQCAPESIKL